ncbi:chromosome partitioning protein ParB [Brachybacterium sp. P6-10-X1]|nr:chromosome partitioning protein ParB [Brachybacterium sp. P6-10-X1]
MTQKRGLGRGLGALIPGAGSGPAPEQELRTRVRPESADEESTPSDRPVDMFFSGESASRDDDRPQRERARRPDLAGDMARAAAQRRGRTASARSASSPSPESDDDQVGATSSSTSARTAAKRSTTGSATAKRSGGPKTDAPASDTATSGGGKSSWTSTTPTKTSAPSSRSTAAAGKSSATKNSSTTKNRSSSPRSARTDAARSTGSGDAPRTGSTTKRSATSKSTAKSPSRPSSTSTSGRTEAPEETPDLASQTVEPTAVQGPATSPVVDASTTTSDRSVTENPPQRGTEPDRGEATQSDAAPEESVGSMSDHGDDGGPGADGGVDAGASPDAAAEPGSEPERSRNGLLSVPGAEFAEIPIHEVRENPRNPRTMFDDDELDELAFSLREVGVLQPVVVRPIPVTEEGESFELVMGERRWRAARRAELTSIPAIIRETSDDDLLRDALLENLHRTQLNPLEEANAYQQLLDDFGCTQDELGDRIGRSRPQITNTLRLLRLPALVQRRLASGALSAGHARALLSLDDPTLMEELAQRIVSEGLSVRAVERLVARGGQQAPARTVRRSSYDPHVVDLTSRLSNRLETPVRIDVGKRKGRITLEFTNLEDLDRVIESMGLDAPAPGTAQESED